MGRSQEQPELVSCLVHDVHGMHEFNIMPRCD